MTHRGQIVEKIVRQSGYALIKIADKLEVSRTTLYNRFNDADLSWEFIKRLGKVIHYDFSLEFPELKEDLNLLEENSAYKLERKYMRLLEKYNKLLGIMLRITDQNGSVAIRRQIVQLLDTGTTKS
jgi:transcriptional regulator with XRE-family HTH domain